MRNWSLFFVLAFMFVLAACGGDSSVAVGSKSDESDSLVQSSETESSGGTKATSSSSEKASAKSSSSAKKDGKSSSSGKEDVKGSSSSKKASAESSSSEKTKDGSSSSKKEVSSSSGEGESSSSEMSSGDDRKCPLDDKQSQFSPSVTYGELYDARDGQTYKTVQIGSQVWMAENLNYEVDDGSFCYHDSVEYCCKYGRLYNYSAAMSACPSGWHLPTIEEWDVLYKIADDYDGDDYYERVGHYLKSTTGWVWDYDDDELAGNGIDVFGFSAVPGGYGTHYKDQECCGESMNCCYLEVGSEAYFWSSSQFYDIDEYYYTVMHSYTSSFETGVSAPPKAGRSVRCVQD